MNTAVIVALLAFIPAILTAIAGIVYNRRTSRTAYRRVVLDAEAGRAKAKTADLAAQSAANEAMAAVAEQMARTSYGFIDRLQTDVHHLQTQLIDAQVSYEFRIKDLQNQVNLLIEQVRLLQNELEQRKVAMHLPSDQAQRGDQ